ncbi:MAG: hypothetical protein R6U58_04480 [Bacteroidales bacterium]
MEISLLGYQKPNDFYSDLISLPGVFLEDEQERTVYWEPELLTGADGSLHLRLPLYREISRLKFIVKGAGYEGGIGLTEFTVEAGD